MKTRHTIEDLQLYALHKMMLYNGESERLVAEAARLRPALRHEKELEGIRELGRSGGFLDMASAMLGRDDEEIARLLADTEMVAGLRSEWLTVSDEAANAEA